MSGAQRTGKVVPKQRPETSQKEGIENTKQNKGEKGNGKGNGNRRPGGKARQYIFGQRQTMNPATGCGAAVQE